MRKRVIFGVLVLCLLVVISVTKYNRGYKILITNDSDRTITNLELRYKTGDMIQTISQIGSERSWKYKVNTDSIQGENAIVLEYNDSKGNPHEEVVAGYLEKGYSGKAELIIKQVDEGW